MNEVVNLTSSGCECVLYTYNGTVTELAQTPGSKSANFTFDISQVPTHFIVNTTGAQCWYASFLVTASSFLFVDLILDIPFVISSTGCQFWLTLFVNNAPAFSNLTITSNLTMSSVVLQFATTGFSLMQSGDIPVITASSNNEDAPNINLLNQSYWLASQDLRQYPTWIQVAFEHRYFVDYTTVVFYKAGEHAGNFTVPLRIYLQCTNDEINWYTIGSWGVYVKEGGWYETTMAFNGLYPFSTYRLITDGGIFGVRQWQLFTDQECTCMDPNVHLVVNFNSTEGLVSITDQLVDIAYFENHTIFDGTLCVGVNNCTLYNEDVTFNGECNDVIYQAYTLNIPKTQTEIILIPTNASTLNPGYNYSVYDHIVGIPGFDLDIIQLAVSISNLLTTSELVSAYFYWYQYTGSPIINNTLFTNYIYYLLPGTYIVTPPGVNGAVRQWVPGTSNFTEAVNVSTWSNLVETGSACQAGTDTEDCGTNLRDIPIMPGYSCTLSQSQQVLQNNIKNASILETRSYTAQNLSQLQTYWNSWYEGILLSRKITQLQLDDCPTQTCPKEAPFRCKSGNCVLYDFQCNLRYNCPGNGCVYLSDVSDISTYQCACDVCYSSL